MDLLRLVQAFGNEVAGSTAVSSLTWPPEKLVVGVSGGADSLALLHVLSCAWGPERLVVAHLNHGLRQEADVEAAFVEQTAVSWRIPCRIRHQDILALARSLGMAFEEAGRFARYRFFAEVAEEVGATAVAVGHNADDQAETVLMHLLRGSGLAGLRGMEPAVFLPEAAPVVLLRPFLSVPRAEIEQYCRQHNLQPRKDTSNWDTTFFRNKLRHDLLPLLTSYSPQIKTHLQNLATIVAADEALLAHLQQEAMATILLEQGDDWLTFSRDAWLALPLSLRRRTLRQMVNMLRPTLRDVSMRPVEQARLLLEERQGGGQAALPGGLRLVREYGHVLMTSPAGAVPGSWPQLLQAAPLPLPVPGKLELENGWVLETAVLPMANLPAIQANPDPWTAYIPHIRQPLFLRPRQAGERFQPLGMNGQTTRLKETMINRKIPASLRTRWPIVANAHHLIWLVGHQLDERMRILHTHQPVVQMRCHRP